MLAKMLTIFRNAFAFALAGSRSGGDTGSREQLTEARSNLYKEADKLERDIQAVGQRSDPIADIIRNIKKVNGH